MPLAALIAAQDQTDVGEGLRATLPLAGRTLIEHQAAIAARAGAGHIILLVERVPASLAQAVDRLRRQGLKIEVARGVADASDRFHPQERILLIGDGCVVAQAAIDRLAATGGPSLLTLPDGQEYGDFERIDGDTRWAGIALMDGAALHTTVQMLGDWDLSSTLLRRLVQQGAQRIETLEAGGDPPLIATGLARTAALEAAMMRAAAPAEGGWAEHSFHRLLAAPLVAPLIAHRIDPLHVALGAVGLAWIGALLTIFAFFWPAVVLLPLAAILASAERRMTGIWTREGSAAMPLLIARHAAAFCALAMITRSVAAEGGWGWWLIAAFVPLALTGLWSLLPFEKLLALPPSPRWIASVDALVWITPPLAILAGWRWMIVVLACTAILSFLSRFVAMRREAAAASGAGV